MPTTTARTLPDASERWRSTRRSTTGFLEASTRMTKAVVFDFGAVLFHWQPLTLLQQCVPELAPDEALPPLDALTAQTRLVEALARAASAWASVITPALRMRASRSSSGAAGPRAALGEGGGGATAGTPGRLSPWWPFSSRSRPRQ